MRTQILGVLIDAITRAEAGRRVEAMLHEPRGHAIATPNPEMLVAASADADFRGALRAADMTIPDGFGLLLVSRLLGQPIPERITGTDFIDDVCAIAVKQHKRVFLLGGEGERVAERAAEELVKRHPGLKIAGARSGFKVFWESPATPIIEGDTLVAVKAAAPDILFVAFGHRKQELWIQKTLPHLPSVRLAMGVGGAFDFIAGDVLRAPSIMRKLGLEWLWRLALEPRKRFRRIWTAVAVFPYLALTARRNP